MAQFLVVRHHYVSMKTLIWFVIITAAIFYGVVVTAQPHNGSDDKLTKQIAVIIAECQKVRVKDCGTNFSST